MFIFHIPNEYGNNYTIHQNYDIYVFAISRYTALTSLTNVMI